MKNKANLPAKGWKYENRNPKYETQGRLKNEKQSQFIAGIG
jgi:hypothetical protein